MKLQYYRYFLNKVNQLSLFEDKYSSRKEVLKDVFTQTHTFEYGKSELGYVFDRIEGDYIYAKIGKRSHLTRRLPPEQHFDEERDDDWPFCRVFISLSSDSEQGQKIAFEVKRSVFRDPINQLRALTDKINETLVSYGLIISVNPISSQVDFWRLVEENQGSIEELVLSFSAPNLFNLENDLNEDLRTATETFGITDASIILKNKEEQLKIPRDNPLINQSVEYITQGGGEYKLKASGTIHSNKEGVKSKDVDLSFDIETSDQEAYIKIMKEILE